MLFSFLRKLASFITSEVLQHFLFKLLCDVSFSENELSWQQLSELNMCKLISLFLSEHILPEQVCIYKFGNIETINITTNNNILSTFLNICNFNTCKEITYTLIMCYIIFIVCYIIFCQI